MRSDNKIIWRVYLQLILELLVPGILLTAVVFVISLFRTGVVAEAMRLFCIIVLLIFLAVSILRASLIFAIAYVRWKKQQKGMHKDIQ